MEEENSQILAADEEDKADLLPASMPASAPIDQDKPNGLIPRRLFSSPPRDNGEGNCDNSGEDDNIRIRINQSRPMNENNEGSIILNISNLSSLRSKITTPYHYIANLPWRLAAKTERSKRTSDVKFFSVYIDCNPESESTLWSCDALVEFKLISQKNGETTVIEQPHFSRQFSNRFNFNSNNWGFPSFMEYNEIICPEKGFVKNDKVIVEAKISVQKVVGVRSNLSYDFLSHQPNVADMVLIIDGRRLYVSKSYLALYSPVFHAMFFSNFLERERKEIVVADVVFEEFVEMLSVIYPSHKAVNAENVEYLLELGDKFEIQFIMEQCEKFLISSEEIRPITKLVWADQYFLADLQNSCLRSLTTVAEVRLIRLTEDYKNLSDVTKAALFEKLLKIVT